VESEPVVTFAVREDCSASAHFYDGLQTVALYDISNDDRDTLPVEVRSWRSSRAISPKQLEDLLDSWSKNRPIDYEFGISSEEVRGLPVGSIHRAMQSHLRNASLAEDFTTEVPSPTQVEAIISAGLIPDQWRNSRDFRAHARALRGTLVYLRAVYVDQSVQPMRSVAGSEAIDLTAARKLIEQSRAHGYLTRTDRSVGGFLTDKGRQTASIMMLAATEAETQ